ncbi:hypothetical protein OVY01_21540 [Robbsia sp. Bb-Pol-6]|uniref:Holin n=1 Tax=Robbsia betulipollinis TaxID=2981849 RepID=A0ABT3ZU32_9BURK|nr:hypothetical protein [Robbsia betulipollinis]MCY0389730.1 hypothetical protein [Robbsia betulipollinis]
MPRIVLAELLVLSTLSASASYAAVTVTPPGETTNDAFIKYVWVLLIAVLAWAASSLPVLAEWEGGGGRRRLVIAQGILQAVFFGFVAFWASVGAGQNIMASYIAAASAAYLGERHFVFGRKNKTEGADVPDKHPERGEP